MAIGGIGTWAMPASSSSAAMTHAPPQAQPRAVHDTTNRDIDTDTEAQSWALRSDLELCGAVRAPQYADGPLDSETHLSTFDVSERGHAVLLDDGGRLFLLNLFQPRRADDTASASSPVRLLHLELDPPLAPREVRAIETVRVNATGTSILLVARHCVRVVQIPPEAEHVLTGAPSSVGPTLRSTDAKRALLAASRSRRQQFLVRFQNGATESVSVEVSGGGDRSSGNSGASRGGDTGLTVSQRMVERQLAANTGSHQQHLAGNIASVSREIYCSSVRTVGRFTQVRHAAWHPLSTSHVVVLSDAEELTVFNLAHDVDAPEQRHLLDFHRRRRNSNNNNTSSSSSSTASASSVSFSFGSPAMLWDVFTVYILRSDGSIFALCPLVPYDTEVPDALLATLRNEVDGQLLIASKTPGAISDRAIAELRSQKYWLQEAWAPVRAASGSSGMASWRCLQPHLSDISPESWPLALQGPVGVSPASVLEGKNHLEGGASACSLATVHYTLPSTDNESSLATSPFLIRVFTSGHVELVLLDSSVRPRWQSEALETSTVKMALPALLLECLSLGVDDSGGRAVLECDANDSRFVYCLHSTGVHVINVGWVFALAAAKKFSSLPSSSVRHIFSVSPPNMHSSANVMNVIGARVIKNVLFGHLMLIRLASGDFEIVNVSAASSELLKGVLLDRGDAALPPSSSLPDTLASLAASKSVALTSSSSALASSSTSASGVRSFADIVVEKLEALAPRGTRVKGNTALHEVNDNILAFVLERVKSLYEDVEYVDVMDQLIRDRVKLQREMLQTQREKVVQVQENVDVAQDSLAKLQEKVARAMQAQENLRKRAAAVLQAVKENQPMLSRAEREYQHDLEGLSVEVRRMKPRVAQLTVAGQRLVRNLENAALAVSASSGSSLSASILRSTSAASLLSEEKKKMCYDVLRAEAQLIEDARELITDMRTNLEQIKK